MDGDRHDVELDALYRDTVLDHFRSPRGHKTLDRTDVERDGYNPVCGDKITLSVKLSEHGVEDVATQCKGCVISVASASMLAELLPGKSREEALQLAETFKRMMHGSPPPEGCDIGDLDALEGVRNFPVRVKCALLPWMTLIDALKEAETNGRKAGSTTTEEKGTT